MSVQSVALASLTATYTDSEGEDGVEDERLQEENSNTPQGAAPHNAQVGRQPQARSGTSPISGGRSASHSPAVGKSAGSSSDLPEAATKVQRLVSYFDDAVVSDDEGVTVAAPPPSVLSVPSSSSSSLMTTGAAVVASIAEHPEENGLPAPTGNVTATTVASTTVVAVGGGAERRSPSSRSGELVSDNGGEAVDPYGVTIPPEPPGQCPAELQDKIARLYRKMESGGLDMNMLIQQRKEFRNPSIYEKLIQFCSINELGTNYPPDRFDPFKWSKDSYYEELALVQKAEMDKLEKARKEKKIEIEIVSGTAKRPNSSSSGTENAKKRKSKWDQVATSGAAAAAAVAAAAAAAVTAKPTVLLTQPTLTTLTSSGTSAKPTVLSAFGSLPKKRL